MKSMLLVGEFKAGAPLHRDIRAVARVDKVAFNA